MSLTNSCRGCGSPLISKRAKYCVDCEHKQEESAEGLSILQREKTSTRFFLCVCSRCGETYDYDHTSHDHSHGLCPECFYIHGGLPTPTLNTGPPSMKLEIRGEGLGTKVFINGQQIHYVRYTISEDKDLLVTLTFRPTQIIMDNAGEDT